MKKIKYLILLLIIMPSAFSLTSCLKDQYVDFSKSSPIVLFPLGGLQNFGADAITETPDTDANGTIVRQFAINVASPKVPTTATEVTLGIDNSVVTSYDATESSVNYLPMPTSAYAFNATHVTIPAGQRYAIVAVTFYKNKLDPSQSYMLPIRIISAGGITVSGNMGLHYYHFIGNDFAGAYLATFVRVPAGGNYTNAPVTLLPVSPTEFLAPGGYAGARYDVTFTKTGNGASATYTNFAVSIYGPDKTAIFDPAPPIVITSPPAIIGYDPNHAYTYDEVVHGLLRFTYSVVNGSGASRVNTDTFVKP